MRRFEARSTADPTQAFDFGELFEAVRAHAPRLTRDRALSADFRKLAAAIRRGDFDL